MAHLFHLRAGVEVIRDWSSEDWPWGKPQETNWRQADVINQMFNSHEKRQWFRGWGRLKKPSCVGAKKLTFNIGLRSRVVMATQSCLETLSWRESGLWPWCWIISWTSLQGKARQESHSTELWKKSNTNFKHFLLLCDCCFTKYKCTFQFN